MDAQLNLAALRGGSPRIVAIRSQVAQLLARQTGARRLPPVLILGETGTGKGLLARAIHQAGPRRDGAFVDVNCAAIPETLLEAELFGYERGAFTDARQAKPGLFQTAHGGTLFLDEIGLLPVALQSKLLTVLEDRAVRRLGSNRNEPVDVALVAATSVDLKRAVTDGRFREDLYHRLAVIGLELPPLRSRGADVLALAEHFLARACTEYGLVPRALTPGARDLLVAYQWPGNVRELANVMERAVLLSDTEVITAAMLDSLASDTREPARVGDAAAGSSLDDALRARIEAALRAAGGNIRRTAAVLGIARNTLRSRMDKYGLRHHDASPARPAAPESVAKPAPAALTRWERRHLAFLRAKLLPSPTTDVVRALEVIGDKVRSFGGRIEESGPTGVIAVFGLEPVDNAPSHAALAALAVQNAASRARALGAEAPEVAIGLHCGDHIVGHQGSTIQVGVDGKGAAWSSLERLVADSRGGAIFVSDAVAPFLNRGFTFERSRDTERNALVLLRREHVPASGTVTRFVGRESEIETLRQAGARVEQHHGQIVGVLGEPGVGKSRLLHETVGDLRRWLVLSAGCVPYGRNASYFPFIELLKSWGRIQDTETASEVRDAVRKCVPPAAGDPDTIVPPLLDLLGVLPAEDAFRRIEPVQRRHHIHDSLKRVFLTASAAQPLCLVVEDLHWVDAESQAVLDLLVESIPASRVLILANYRPEYRHGWGSKTYFRQLQLHPLAGHSAADLARELLGTDPSLEGLSPLLIQRTDGNPFFLEESVRSLVEAGALSGQRGAYRLVTDHPVVDVPATVQAILSARIDHLPPEEKTLLQTAAIIGKEFPFALLQAIAGLTESTLRERLAALQGAEFLYETRFFPDLEYTFKHALTQEVAYGSLAQERRRALHGGIVDALEKLHADRPDEQVERLAHHAQQGEMWEQAVTYLRRAGLKALARSAGREAVSCFEQALEALGHRPRSRQTQELAIDLRFDLKTSLFPLGAFERMVDSLREAEGLARRLDDRRRLGQVYIHLCHTIGLAGHSTEAVAFGQNARAIAESLGDVALQVTANLFLGGAYLRAGDYRRAEDLVLRVLELTEGKPVSSAVTGRSYLTWICAGRGDFKQGIAHGQEGLRLAEALNNPVGLANMCSYLGHLQLARGEFERAVGLFARGLALTREWSLPYFSAGHSGGLGSAHAFLGRTAEGISLMEQAVSAFEAMGVRFAQSLFLVLLGEGYVLADRLADALEISARGLTVAREHGHRDVEARALRLLGEVSARRDPPERAEGHYRDALALAEELEMRPLAAHCHLGLGKLYRRIGDSEQAQERLAVAAAMYREMDMRFWLEKAEAEIGAADVG